MISFDAFCRRDELKLNYDSIEGDIWLKCVLFVLGYLVSKLEVSKQKTGGLKQLGDELHLIL